MTDLLAGLTPIRVLPKRIDADCYNRIRLLLIRNPPPLRVVVPNHRGLEIILTHQAWLGVDALVADQPLVAWSEFETTARSALTEPVACRVSLYHVQAGLIMGSALDALAANDWQFADR